MHAFTNMNSLYCTIKIHYIQMKQIDKQKKNTALKFLIQTIFHFQCNFYKFQTDIAADSR